MSLAWWNREERGTLGLLLKAAVEMGGQLCHVGLGTDWSHHVRALVWHTGIGCPRFHNSPLGFSWDGPDAYFAAELSRCSKMQGNCPHTAPTWVLAAIHLCTRTRTFTGTPSPDLSRRCCDEGPVDARLLGTCMVCMWWVHCQNIHLSASRTTIHVIYTSNFI